MKQILCLALTLVLASNTSAGAKPQAANPFLEMILKDSSS